MHRLIVALVFGAFAPLALAAAPRVEAPWIRETPPGVPTGAAYARLVGTGTADKLIGARTDVADHVEIHTHVHSNGMMQMKQIESLAIAADGQATLQPGGDHLMLIGLRRPLVAGQPVTITLVFETAGEIAVRFDVLDARATQAPMPAPEHH